MHGCGVGIEAFPSPINAPAMSPPLITISGLTPRNAGFHRTRSASFPTSHGTDMFANPMRDGRIDSVLGNVALHPKVVVVGKVLIQFAALTFHLVRGLPCAANDLADSAHRLRIQRHHTNRAQVVQDVFGAYCLDTDPLVVDADVSGSLRW